MAVTVYGEQYRMEGLSPVIHYNFEINSSSSKCLVYYGSDKNGFLVTELGIVDMEKKLRMAKVKGKALRNHGYAYLVDDNTVCVGYTGNDNYMHLYTFK